MTVATRDTMPPVLSRLNRSTEAPPTAPNRGIPGGWRDLPVLPGTQLRLEVALFRDPPDLRELTSILREDPVAVLRLFAMTAGILAPSEDPLRLEDLIVMLEKEDLLQAFCRQAPTRGAEATAVLAFAGQAYAIGQMCCTLAVTTGLPREEAFLIGLLHNISSLPGQLGRPITLDTTSAPQSSSLGICREFALPLQLQRAIHEVERKDASSPWSAIVDAAYELLATPARSGPSCVRISHVSGSA